MVFFDFNQSRLTNSTQEILNTIISDINHLNTASFEITGHTDRSGKAAYNKRLSKKRAEAVKKALVGLGAKSHNIDVTWHGESTPLIPTSDGMREPQNRRAEIRINSAQ